MLFQNFCVKGDLAGRESAGGEITKFYLPPVSLRPLSAIPRQLNFSYPAYVYQRYTPRSTRHNNGKLLINPSIDDTPVLPFRFFSITINKLILYTTMKHCDRNRVGNAFFIRADFLGKRSSEYERKRERTGRKSGKIGDNNDDVPRSRRISNQKCRRSEKRRSA